MAKSATVRALMEPQKKENVSKILKRLGMNHSEAIDLRIPKSRPEVMEHLNASIEKNRRLGELLAK